MYNIKNRTIIEVEDDIFLEAQEWCKENCIGEVKWYHNIPGYFGNKHSIAFYEESDAVAFKLRWL